MIPSSSHNRTGNGSSGFSYKWLARGVALITILELLLQLRFFYPGLSLRGPLRKGTACTLHALRPRGDPAHLPFVAHDVDPANLSFVAHDSNAPPSTFTATSPVLHAFDPPRV